MELTLKVENQGDISNVLQVNQDQLQAVSNNPEFSSNLNIFENLIKSFGYQFDLNVNMLGNKDINLVLNALASALITDPADLHNFVWNEQGYNIGRLLTLLSEANIDAVIERMHEYITDRNLLGSDQAWNPEFATENKKHIARILWHIRNTIRTYDEKEYSTTVGGALENEIIEEQKAFRDIMAIMESQFQFENFLNFDHKTFRDKHNSAGLRGILELISMISTLAMPRLEKLLPGDENKVRRLQLLEGVLDHFGERYIEQLENLYIRLIENSEFNVDLGVQGVGKGTIADSLNILKDLLKTSEDVKQEVGKGNKEVRGVKLLQTSFNGVDTNVRGFLSQKFGLLSSSLNGEVHTAERATGTHAMFNPDPVDPNNPSIYDVYRDRVSFAGQFVPAGLMLGDKITHMLVMVENCLAALEAREKKTNSIQLKWDVYPRTEGQVALMKKFIEKIGDKASLQMSNFFGFTVKTLETHKQNPLKSKSAALAWGAIEGKMKSKSLINEALTNTKVFGSVYALIVEKLEGNEYADLRKGLEALTDQKDKFVLLQKNITPQLKEKLRVLILENNALLEELFVDNTFNAIIQEELQAELGKAKYASININFIGKLDEIKSFFDDYVRQTRRSLDLIADRIAKDPREDDMNFFETMGRMASNDRESLPMLYDELDHYAVGYEGGEAFAQYLEQMVGKNVPGFDKEDSKWKELRALLSVIHSDVNISKKAVINFAEEA